MHLSSVIENIISYLPQRSVYECLTIFTFYQLTTNVKLNAQPTTTQIKKPIKTLTLSGKLKSYLVQHIHIHFQICDKIHTLLFCLKHACPNVETITFYDNHNQPIIHQYQDSFLHPLLHQWRLITHFPSWSGDEMELWLNTIAHQLTHLSLRLNNDHYLTTQQPQSQQKSLFGYSNSSNNNNNKQLDNGLKLPSFSFSLTKRIYFKSDRILQPKYHIMQIVFPLNTFHQLKVLQLDLGPISTSFMDIKSSSSSSSWQYPLFSQFTFDNLQSSCPLLQTLELQNFNMYIWYPNENQNIDSTYPSFWERIEETKACTHLLSLQLDNVLFYHPLTLAYLAKKYPYLKSLKLNISGFKSLEHGHYLTENQLLNANNYKNALYLLMTQSPFITTLHIQFITNKFGSQWKSSYLNTMVTYWPNAEILTWLETYPKRLKNIHLPCSEIYKADYYHHNTWTPHLPLPGTTQKEEEAENDLPSTLPMTTTEMLSRRLYLCYLTSLTLTFIHESPNHLLEKYLKSSSIPSYTHRHNNENRFLQNLKSLKIINCDENQPFTTSITSTTHIRPSFQSPQNEKKLIFSIYIWLEAIPKLQKLEIHGMSINEAPAFSMHKSGFQSQQQQDQYSEKRNYQLKELIISKCNIELEYNFNRIFNFCPSLTKFHCIDAVYHLINVATFPHSNPSVYCEKYNHHQDMSFQINQRMHSNTSLPSSSNSNNTPYNPSVNSCLLCSEKYSLPDKTPLKLIIPNHYLDDIQFRNVKLLDTVNCYGNPFESSLNDIFIIKRAEIKQHRRTLFNYHKTALVIVCQAFNTVKIDDRWIHY
ncbi:unnamed protein product [Cunninghamella blakesleeana]